MLLLLCTSQLRRVLRVCAQVLNESKHDDQARLVKANLSWSNDQRQDQLPGQPFFMTRFEKIPLYVNLNLSYEKVKAAKTM